MSRIAIVYWSGTGNTEMMAKAISDGVQSTGSKADVFQSIDFSSDLVQDYDVLAFGCPSMGCEELESGEFEPMFDSCAPLLKNKPIALFGSYGWGDGEWMETWENNCQSQGITLMQSSLILNETPDDEGLDKCNLFGKGLVS